MVYIVSFLLGFIFGIIPFSYLIGRIKGVDLKKVGSGNIGATNLSRSLGIQFFILGFILDGVKGLIPVLIAKALFSSGSMAAAGAIIGHIFNPFFGFKGGKGVSTTIGVAIGLIPRSFFISIIIWLGIYLITYLVSLASIIFAVVLPLVAITLQDGKPLDRIFAFIIALFIIYAHRTNIKRLLHRKEPKTIFWRKK